MEIEVKNIEEIQVAYISVKWPYDQLPELLGEVVGYVMKENLQIIGPHMEYISTAPWKYRQKNCNTKLE